MGGHWSPTHSYLYIKKIQDIQYRKNYKWLDIKQQTRALNFAISFLQFSYFFCVSEVYTFDYFIQKYTNESTKQNIKLNN